MSLRSLQSPSRRWMLAGAAAALASGAILDARCALAFSLPQDVSTPPLGKIGGADSLRVSAEQRGLLTGFAVLPALLRTDSKYTSIIRDQANLIVAENAMKWDALRPSATTYDFADADALLSFAETNRMKMRGHNLLWHRSIPKWFTATATKENARQLLETHIETVAGRYAGRIHSWDVVNEAIQVDDGRPDGLRDSAWLRLVGDDYVEIAFRAAKRADSKALLTYNEYGIEAEGAQDEAKRQAVLVLLRKLRARNVPIDAVGVQSHIAAGPQARYGAGLARFLASVRELGLQVFISEMDVNDRNLPPETTGRDRAVAETYRAYLDLVLSDPAVTAVMIWGVSDKFTWLNQEDSRKDGTLERPLLFDAEYKPKPDFFAVRESFAQRMKSRV